MAERINAERLADGVKAARDEISRLKRYVLTQIGKMEVTKVTVEDLNATLDFAKSQGLSRQTVKHIRQDLRTIFKTIRREGVIKSSPADYCEMPRFRKTEKRERAVLSDVECKIYLNYDPPVENKRDRIYRVNVQERQVMSAVARTLGGARTGDVHALDWKDFERDETGFLQVWLKRRKTRVPQLLGICKILRTILEPWWILQGKPTTGPVFPTRKGNRAGEKKGRVTHARSLRRDLQRAFLQASAKGVQDAPEKGSRRWSELFEETSHTRPVDYHSFRRAFIQALADAGVPAQQAMVLAGHGHGVHDRYMQNPNKVIFAPEISVLGSEGINTGKREVKREEKGGKEDDGNKSVKFLSKVPFNQHDAAAGVRIAQTRKVSQEKPIKTAVMPKSLALGAGCRRFKSFRPD
ncbi:MAG: tyrosine-type recombinase/integrase [Deltaproteobacteria bacterium]|nr:tyrosine-type recombinase/integrase [Deltaproteobacteria bacterium]